MKYNLILFLFAGLSVASFTGFSENNEECHKFFSIPTRTIDLDSIAGYDGRGVTFTVPAFEISNLVTLGEYKIYLQSVKADSSHIFYLSQLPKTAFQEDVFREYISKPVYEPWPVLGISWGNAMNYCKWMTIKSNGDNIDTIYRLPASSEWLSAWDYMNENKISHDYNQKYAEWLFNSFDEAVYFMGTEKTAYDAYYFAKPVEPSVLKRKRVIGDCYHFQPRATVPHPFSYYQYEGYHYIGFRIVKENKARRPAFTTGTTLERQPVPLSDKLLEYWRGKQ